MLFSYNKYMFSFIHFEIITYILNKPASFYAVECFTILKAHKLIPILTPNKYLIFTVPNHVFMVCHPLFLSFYLLQFLLVSRIFYIISDFPDFW